MPDEDQPINDPDLADSDQVPPRISFLVAVGAARICDATSMLLAELSAARPKWNGPHPRMAVGHGLAAFLTFLRQVDLDPGDRHRPIAELLGALQELEYGSVSPRSS